MDQILLLLYLVERFLTNSLLKLLEWYEAALLAVEDGAATPDEAVPLGDPVQVAGGHLVGVGDGGDDGAGQVRQTVPEVGLVQQRHRGRVPAAPVVLLQVGGLNFYIETVTISQYLSDFHTHR